MSKTSPIMQRCQTRPERKSAIHKADWVVAAVYELLLFALASIIGQKHLARRTQGQCAPASEAAQGVLAQVSGTIVFGQ
jgi:hypothetical protein